MDVIKYDLDLEVPSTGGYLSSEQIDLLRIYECDSPLKLIEFIKGCSQIKHKFSEDEFIELCRIPLDSAKEMVISSYKSTMVFHDKRDESSIKKLMELGFSREDIVEIIVLLQSGNNKYEAVRKYLESKNISNINEILDLSHEMFSLERDQIKSCNLKDISLLSKGISDVDTILIGSGKYYHVINPMYHDGEDGKYNFYFVERDLDYAKDHGKKVRYHSLLVKEDEIFSGLSKEQIKAELKAYVKASIDFITYYNRENGNMIVAVDLFNELISFDPMVPCSLEENPLGWRAAQRKDGRYIEQGEYKNIWELKYGLTLEDIVEIFDYALVHKPEGVSYLYNEPFLEDSTRREKVISTLEEINYLADERKREVGFSDDSLFIDTIGSQMHIVVGQDTEEIREEFSDFRRLQRQGYRVEITEFDCSLSYHDAIMGIGNSEQIESYRRRKGVMMDEVSDIIRDSGVKLGGLTYWSITDKLDHNLERIRTDLYRGGKTIAAESLETVCAGRVCEDSSTYQIDKTNVKE